MPLDLELHEVAVQVDEVRVDLTVTPGAGGQLGNLLCAVTRLVEGSAPAAELVRGLNMVLDTIG
jgi:hypothetical protein